MLRRTFVVHECFCTSCCIFVFIFMTRKRLVYLFFFPNGGSFWRYNLLYVILLWQGSWAGWSPEVPNSSVILGWMWAQHLLWQ